MTLGQQLIALYERRTDADFAHMERKLAELPPGQPVPDAALIAATLLYLRAMELAEREVA